MRLRKFQCLSHQEQIKALLHCLLMAMNEGHEMQSKWKTDIYGIALQYGGHYGIKREDFKKIKNQKVGKLIKDFLKNGETNRKRSR